MANLSFWNEKATMNKLLPHMNNCQEFENCVSHCVFSVPVCANMSSEPFKARHSGEPNLEGPSGMWDKIMTMTFNSKPFLCTEVVVVL